MSNSMRMCGNYSGRTLVVHLILLWSSVSLNKNHSSRNSLFDTKRKEKIYPPSHCCLNIPSNRVYDLYFPLLLAEIHILPTVKMYPYNPGECCGNYCYTDKAAFKMCIYPVWNAITIGRRCNKCKR